MFGLHRDVDHGRELIDGACFEKVSQRQIDAESFAHARHHLRYEERVAAEFEEVVKLAHVVQGEHFAPDACDYFGYGRACG